MQGKVNTYAKVKRKYYNKGLVSCKSMRKLIWLSSWNTWNEMLRKIAVLRFLGKHESDGDHFYPGVQLATQNIVEDRIRHRYLSKPFTSPILTTDQLPETTKATTRQNLTIIIGNVFLRIHWRLLPILKASNKSVWNNIFCYVKVCIFGKCIQMLKKVSFRQNKRYKKCPLFSFASSNSS